MSLEQEIDMVEATPVNILIVEDDYADRLLLVRRIQHIIPNSNIAVVQTLRDANKYCAENKIDLILLDLNLPDGYGPSSVNDIRKHHKKTPVIVITGFGVQMTADEAVKQGANNVFLKSEINSDEFIDVLKRCLR